MKVYREMVGPAVLGVCSTSLMFASLALSTELGVTAWVVVPLALLGLGGCYYAGRWERQRAVLHYYWGYKARERDEASEYARLLAHLLDEEPTR